MPRQKKRSSSSSSKKQKQKNTEKSENSNGRKKSDTESSETQSFVEKSPDLEKEMDKDVSKNETPCQEKRLSTSSGEKQKQKNKGKSENANGRKERDTENNKTEVFVEKSPELEKEMDKTVSVSEKFDPCKNGQTKLQHCNDVSNKTEKSQFSENVSCLDRSNLNHLIENVKKKATSTMERNSDKYLQQLLKMATSDSCQLVTYLAFPENRFQDCLNESMDLTIASLWLIIISKACQSSFQGCNKHIIMLVLSSEFWTITIPSVLSNISNQDEGYQFIDLLIITVTIMNHCIFDETLFEYIEGIPMNCELKLYMTSKVENLKIELMHSWNNINNCIEFNQNRYNETVLPLEQDLDQTFPPLLNENTLSGSYNSIDYYLDTHFYLLKENFIGPYRTSIDGYRNKKYDEVCNVHSNVIAIKKYFDVNGIHVKLLFPARTNHQEHNNLNENIDLCLSQDDFYTKEFATVISVKPRANGKCLVYAKLLDYDPCSIVIGGKYVVVESAKFGSIHRQILHALKLQKTVSLHNGIVFTEKSINPPSYINKSTVIELPPTLLPCEENFSHSFLNTKHNYSANKKVEVMSSWSKSNNLSVFLMHATALEEVLQRELSLVKGNKEMGKFFLINLLKILDFNKIIWRKKYKPLLVVCESDNMCEELSAEIKMFSNNSLILFQNIQDGQLVTKRKKINMFEKAAMNCGKHVDDVLKEIQFCEDYPLKAMELRNIVQHGNDELLKQNCLKKWLGLTEDEANFCGKDNSDLYEKKLVSCQQKNRYSPEFFETVTCQMLKNSTEMSDLEANNITDIWSLNLAARWNLALRWMNNYIVGLKKKLNIQKKDYHHNMEVLDDLSCNFEWKYLSKADIVCVTIHNAIKKAKIIKKLDLPIIIVIEADTIPEPYLIPFLTPTLKHLILIGHTEQPLFIDRRYDYSVSMYHRLVANGLLVSDLMKENELEHEKCAQDAPALIPKYDKHYQTNTVCYTLPCGHRNSLPSNEDVSYKCQIPTCIILNCGHQITVPCSEKDKKRECVETVKTVLPCNHSVSYKCCERNITNIVCTKTKEVQLPCNHTVEIQCVELSQKREEYFSNGCYHICNVVLDCGHPCIGKCSECTCLAVHKGCNKKCDILLPCGHICQGLCNVPCPPCSLPCEWECSHGQCQKLCGELCDPCRNQCTRTCEHRRCDKMCWEKCDTEPCEESCLLLLKCGHNCGGICGEPCPSLCPTCNADKYAELYVNECPKILELACGHILNFKALTIALNKMSEENERPICPDCKNVLKNQGYVGNFVQKWFQTNHETKMNVKNLVQAAVNAFRFNPIVIKGHWDHSGIESILDTMENSSTLSNFVLGKINILYIIILVEIVNTVKSLENCSDHVNLATKCEKLCSWIRISWENVSFEQLESCSWEIFRLHQLSVVYTKQQKIEKYIEAKKSLSFIRTERICRQLLKTKQYNEFYDKKIQTELTKISQENPTLGNLFVKRIHPLTKEKYHMWLKGNITREELTWNLEGYSLWIK